MKPFGPMGIDPVIELVFMSVVMITCLVIYFKTKEIYQLSQHKGLKYFRYVFLFLGISYLCRTLIGLSEPFFLKEAFFPPFWKIISIQIFSIIKVYAGTAMFAYLLLTLLWKKLDKTFISNRYFINGFSIALTIISYSLVPYAYILFQITAFITVISLMIINRHKIFNKNQNPWVTATYAMIFGNWLLVQLLETFTIAFPRLGTALYLITMCFFVMLVDRVWLHFSNSNAGNENEKTRKIRTNKRHSNNNKRKK